jgi:osmotically-inducible protein OsmY
MQTLPPSTPTEASTAITCPVSNPVLDRINECLGQSHYREMRGINCDFREGIAILQGRVCSFYAKQTAQELIRHIDGVESIRNNVEVV